MMLCGCGINLQCRTQRSLVPTGMRGITAAVRTACSSQVGKGHIIMSVIPLPEPLAHIPASQGVLSII